MYKLTKEQALWSPKRNVYLRWGFSLLVFLTTTLLVRANSSVAAESPVMEEKMQQTIRGAVLDNKGNTVPGATVLEKGTTNGISTDIDGNYTISVSDQNSVLVFSFVGFETQEIIVGNQSIINVTLQEDEQTLDEFVVTGYGEVQRNRFVGATSVATAEELEQQPITTVEQGIRGRLAGVQVVQSSGAPGAGVSIRVRGLTSFAGGMNPYM